jgi:hypothetical protein
MTADYLREQAATCMLWSRECFDLATAKRLRLMAEEFLTKATELDSSRDREISFDSLRTPHLAALDTRSDAS